MILRFVILSLVATSLIACGSASQNESSATLAASSRVKSEAVINDPTALPINGGINPSAFAYEISGSVRLGTNSCFAQGKTVRLEQKQREKTISVVAIISSEGSSSPRICPMDYSPVDVKVETIVRANFASVNKVVLKNVNSLGTTVDVRNLVPADEIVVTNVAVSPINGGINPEFFGYSIKATVEAGANRCVADSSKVELVQKSVGSVIYVSATRKTVLDRPCTMEYSPVFKTLEIQVRGSRITDSRVVVKNIDTLGQLTDVSALINGK